MRPLGSGCWLAEGAADRHGRRGPHDGVRSVLANATHHGGGLDVASHCLLVLLGVKLNKPFLNETSPLHLLASLCFAHLGGARYPPGGTHA